jgi:CDP-diacylglycerol---serine O-phosphatidyltransferase
MSEDNLNPSPISPPKKRGIYILPNLFTTAALFSGFYAIISAIQQDFKIAAISIFVAMILDMLDGRIARMTNTQSAFGAEYDSLSDMISFGVAPALLMYQWSLNSFGELGWLAAFVYTAATALRLARFNTQVGTMDKAYFQGLASPAAAALIAGTVWLGTFYQIQGSSIIFFTFPITVLAGVLMVSNIRYRSFKDFDLKGRIPFIKVLFIVLIFVFIAIKPSHTLFFFFFGYALSGPIMTLVELNKRRLQRIKTTDTSNPPT